MTLACLSRLRHRQAMPADRSGLRGPGPTVEKKEDNKVSKIGKFEKVLSLVLVLGVFLIFASYIDAVKYQEQVRNLLVKGWLKVLYIADIDSIDADDIHVSGYIDADGYKLGDSYVDAGGGRLLTKIINKNGSNLTAGDVCVWDATAIEVVAKALAGVKHTVTAAGTLSTGEYGYNVASVIFDGTCLADTVDFYGTERDSGANFHAQLVVASGSSPTKAVLRNATQNAYWTQMDSIKSDKMSGGADSLTVNAYPLFGVIACDGANTDIAGVVVSQSASQDTIADNSQGWIATHGYVQATVDAGTNAASPGVLLEGASGGDFVVDPMQRQGKMRPEPWST